MSTAFVLRNPETGWRSGLNPLLRYSRHHADLTVTTRDAHFPRVVQRPAGSGNSCSETMT